MCGNVGWRVVPTYRSCGFLRVRSVHGDQADHLGYAVFLVMSDECICSLAQRSLWLVPLPGEISPCPPSAAAAASATRRHRLHHQAVYVSPARRYYRWHCSPPSSTIPRLPAAQPSARPLVSSAPVIQYYSAQADIDNVSVMCSRISRSAHRATTGCHFLAAMC